MTGDFQQCGMCDQQSLRSACAYAQSGQSLCLSLEYSMSVKLLTEHHLEFLSLRGGYTGPSESTLVKIPHCWKSHVAAHFQIRTLIWTPSIAVQSPSLCVLKRIYRHPVSQNALLDILHHRNAFYNHPSQIYIFRPPLSPKRIFRQLSQKRIFRYPLSQTNVFSDILNHKNVFSYILYHQNIYPTKKKKKRTT